MLRLRMLVQKMLDVVERTIEMALAEPVAEPLFVERLREAVDSEIKNRGPIGPFDRSFLQWLADTFAMGARIEFQRRIEMKKKDSQQEESERLRSEAYERGFKDCEKEMKLREHRARAAGEDVGRALERDRIVTAITEILGVRQALRGTETIAPAPFGPVRDVQFDPAKNTERERAPGLD